MFFRKNEKIIALSVAVLLMVVGLAFQKSSNNEALAASSGNMTGYAWSENIGWINTSNGTKYNVSIDSNNGFISGWAWSEHIGWINFAPAGTPPTSTYNPVLTGTTAKIDLTTGAVSGWARIESIKNEYPSGSGWISLKGSGYGLVFDLATGKIKGDLTSLSNPNRWAWSDDIGWIDFSRVTLNGVSAPKDTATISADATSVAYNGSTTIRWSSSNASTCNVTPSNWTGKTGAQSTGTITSTITYTATCGTATASVTVTVGSPPASYFSITPTVSRSVNGAWQPINTELSITSSPGNNYVIRTVPGKQPVALFAGERLDIDSVMKNVLDSVVYGTYTWTCKYTNQVTGTTKACDASTGGLNYNALGDAYLQFGYAGTFEVTLTATNGGFSSGGKITVIVPVLSELN